MLPESVQLRQQVSDADILACAGMSFDDLVKSLAQPDVREMLFMGMLESLGYGSVNDRNRALRVLRLALSLQPQGVGTVMDALRTTLNQSEKACFNHLIDQTLVQSISSQDGITRDGAGRIIGFNSSPWAVSVRWSKLHFRQIDAISFSGPNWLNAQAPWTLVERREDGRYSCFKIDANSQERILVGITPVENIRLTENGELTIVVDTYLGQRITQSMKSGPTVQVPQQNFYVNR